MTKKCEYCGIELFFEIPKIPGYGRIYKYHKDCYNLVRLEIPSEVGIEILKYLNTVKQDTPINIRNAIYRSKSGSEKQLSKLLDLGYIKRTKSSKGTYYSILAKGKRYLTDLRRSNGINNRN